MGDGKSKGFTLIELSIVLVIIGLLAGGILTGQSLIEAASIRSQIRQIEKFDTATNVFLLKYEYLPGDIPPAPALQFGFAPRGQYVGEGDGNRIIEGNYNNSATGEVTVGASMGESVMFWEDLSKAGLIDGAFTIATASTLPIPAAFPNTQPGVNDFVPLAKIGGANSVYISSLNSINYYFIAPISNLGWGLNSGPGMSVAQAYAIDTKIDDGLPQSGRLQPWYVFGGGVNWASGNFGTAPYTTATAGSSTSCFDNGNAAGATQQYSMAQSNGTSINCSLSIKMTAGN